MILDEATSALDDLNSELVIDFIKKNKSNLTTIIVSHNEKLSQFADQIINIKNANIIVKESLT